MTPPEILSPASASKAEQKIITYLEKKYTLEDLARRSKALVDDVFVQYFPMIYSRISENRRNTFTGIDQEGIASESIIHAVEPKQVYKNFHELNKTIMQHKERLKKKAVSDSIERQYRHLNLDASHKEIHKGLHDRFEDKSATNPLELLLNKTEKNLSEDLEANSRKEFMQKMQAAEDIFTHADEVLNPFAKRVFKMRFKDGATNKEIYRSFPNMNKNTITVALFDSKRRIQRKQKNPDWKPDRVSTPRTISYLVSTKHVKEQNEIIYRAFCMGIDLNKIASHFQIGRGQVNKIVKNNSNVEMLRSRREASILRKQETNNSSIYNDFKRGISLEKIAHKHNRTMFNITQKIFRSPQREYLMGMRKETKKNTKQNRDNFIYRAYGFGIDMDKIGEHVGFTRKGVKWVLRQCPFSDEISKNRAQAKKRKFNKRNAIISRAYRMGIDIKKIADKYSMHPDSILKTVSANPEKEELLKKRVINKQRKVDRHHAFVYRAYRMGANMHKVAERFGHKRAWITSVLKQHPEREKLSKQRLENETRLKQWRKENKILSPEQRKKHSFYHAYTHGVSEQKLCRRFDLKSRHYIRFTLERSGMKDALVKARKDFKAPDKDALKAALLEYSLGKDKTEIEKTHHISRHYIEAYAKKSENSQEIITARNLVKEQEEQKRLDKINEVRIRYARGDLYKDICAELGIKSEDNIKFIVNTNGIKDEFGEIRKAAMEEKRQKLLDAVYQNYRDNMVLTDIAKGNGLNSAAAVSSIIKASGLQKELQQARAESEKLGLRPRLDQP